MQLRVATHSGVFDHEGNELAFCRYERNGEAQSWTSAPRRPTVLLHGFGQGAESWAEVAHLLAGMQDAGAVYALDLRAGGGGSGLGQPCARVRDFAAWVARREGVAPVLVGYSMGGRIALEALVRFGWQPGGPSASAGALAGTLADMPAGAFAGAPTNVPAGALPISALVLEGAGLGPANEGERAALLNRNVAWAQRVRDQGVASFMDYWAQLPLFASQQALEPQRRAILREGRLKNTEADLIWAFEEAGQHRQALEPQTLEALSHAVRRGLPLLYVAGSLDGKYRAVAEHVAAAVPGVQTAYVPDAGHNAHFEQPAAFARIISSFLQA